MSSKSFLPNTDPIIPPDETPEESFLNQYFAMYEGKLTNDQVEAGKALFQEAATVSLDPLPLAFFIVKAWKTVWEIRKPAFVPHDHLNSLLLEALCLNDRAQARGALVNPSREPMLNPVNHLDTRVKYGFEEAVRREWLALEPDRQTGRIEVKPGRRFEEAFRKEGAEGAPVVNAQTGVGSQAKAQPQSKLTWEGDKPLYGMLPFVGTPRSRYLLYLFAKVAKIHWETIAREVGNADWQEETDTGVQEAMREKAQWAVEASLSRLRTDTKKSWNWDKSYLPTADSEGFYRLNLHESLRDIPPAYGKLTKSKK